MITPEETAFVIFVNDLWDHGETVSNSELCRLMRLAVKLGLGDYPLYELVDVVKFACEEEVHRYGWAAVRRGSPE
jgi:hypothetical protein